MSSNSDYLAATVLRILSEETEKETGYPIDTEALDWGLSLAEIVDPLSPETLATVIMRAGTELTLPVPDDLFRAVTNAGGDPLSYRSLHEIGGILSDLADHKHAADVAGYSRKALASVMYTRTLDLTLGERVVLLAQLQDAKLALAEERREERNARAEADDLDDGQDFEAGPDDEAPIAVPRAYATAIRGRDVVTAEVDYIKGQVSKVETKKNGLRLTVAIQDALPFSNDKGGAAGSTDEEKPIDLPAGVEALDEAEGEAF